VDNHAVNDNKQPNRDTMQHIRTISSVLVAGIVGLLPASEAWAWSGGGHKVVALTAYSQLDPVTRAKVIQILSHHPFWTSEFQARVRHELQELPAPSHIQKPPPTKSDEWRWLFAQAAVWPDLAQGTPYDRPHWHSINTPIYLNAASEEALRSHLPVNLQIKWTEATPEMDLNAAQALDLAMQVLRDGQAAKQVLPEETLAQKKAILLCWLLHLAGDLHQPTHAVALFSQREFPGGDHGGNDILLPQKPGQNNPQDLHSFWDRLHGGDVTLNAASATMSFILREPGMPQIARAAAANLSVEAWLSEAQALARQKVYVPKIMDAVAKAESAAVHEEKVEVLYTKAELAAYGNSVGPIASERAAIAGYRLAELLKQVLK
jgi:hypothetical protein